MMATLLPAPPVAADWQAGFAAVKITPEGPAVMAGYASRNKPSEGVVADLNAKARLPAPRTVTLLHRLPG